MDEHGLLPFVDARSMDVEAPPRVLWEVLLDSVPGPRDPLWRRAWAGVLGADPRASNGLGAHVIGAERAGFSVCEVVPPATYALAGRHRFARYQLVFRIQAAPAGHSRLTAETFASFPGVPGRAYRALVIGTRGHALVVRLIMRVLRRRAEARARHQEPPFA